ncbi:MAG: PEP-CTERM sorting domain-containing protein [Pirellulales bacterium]
MRSLTRRAALTVAVGLALLATAATPTNANIGDQWILQIHHLDNSGAFTLQPGTGYAGLFSSGNAAFTGTSVLGPASDGVARVYWELSGLSIGTLRPVPTTTEQYTLEFYDPTDVGHNGFNPVESQFRGAAGETFPNEPLIPWAGAFGTNHQFIARDGADSGTFLQLGPGPQAPVDASFGAAPNGFNMWLTSGSWMYAKYNFPFPIDRSWSALRVTQVTGIPEPSTVILAGIGVIGLGIVRRRRKS